MICSCTKDDGTGSSGKHEGHGYVDLGLSVRWATCNVGANSPEEYGNYYAWGETIAKKAFTVENFINGVTTILGDDITGTEYDVAHVKWGGKWRMPTYSEAKELVELCTWTVAEKNGVNGCIVTGPNGNSIFLPAAGSPDSKGVNYDAEKYGNFWTGSCDVGFLDPWEGYPVWSFYFKVDPFRCRLSEEKHYGGRSIRPVCP